MMDTATGIATTHDGGVSLHTVKPMARTTFNRLFMVAYTCGLATLFFHHTKNILNANTLLSFSISLSFLLADFVLAFMWGTSQGFRIRPITRKQYPNNLEEVVKRSEFPALDIFICTADPYKEPPVTVVNTALSVLAYDYPAEKLSVYVSDDGGSELTLFAFIQAAKFAKVWLPFCEENGVVNRSPREFFVATNDDGCCSNEVLKIKEMYVNMIEKVESVVERGKVTNELMATDEERQLFDKWTDGFTRQNHHGIVQVLLEYIKDRDIKGNSMPNLIYVAREKCKTLPHNFKAGALNALLRVSTVMTNAPIILTLDCDMFSNDPQTPNRALCYLVDQKCIHSNLALVQFPQRFKGINEHDIYGCEYKHLFQTNMMGMDGLLGPNYIGSGAFFRRRALFGSPNLHTLQEIDDLRPVRTTNKPIYKREVLDLAHFVVSASNESETYWGSTVGFRYGSLVEDFNTGYRMQCEGWKSLFCNPDKAAFYGDAPISLIDTLNQNKRWNVGLLEVALSKYSPILFGVRSMGFCMGLCYSYYAFWPILSIPITTYTFLPQLALLNGVSILPKLSNPWVVLYAFLCLGSYGQDLLDFELDSGTVNRWWNNQRMWMIRGLSSQLFGYILACLHILSI